MYVLSENIKKKYIYIYISYEILNYFFLKKKKKKKMLLSWKGSSVAQLEGELGSLVGGGAR